MFESIEPKYWIKVLNQNIESYRLIFTKWLFITCIFKGRFKLIKFRLFLFKLFDLLLFLLYSINIDIIKHYNDSSISVISS